MSADKSPEGHSRNQQRNGDPGDASSDEELAQLNRGLVSEARAVVVCIIKTR